MGDGMTTYNTGNPVPSTDPRDLRDNAENYDTAMNDRDSPSWIDRLGRPRKTFAEIERLADPGTVLAAVESAEDAAKTAVAANRTVFRSTYDLLLAAMQGPPAQPADTPGRVTNDPDPNKNGDYTWNGTTLIFSNLQPIKESDLDALRDGVDASVADVNKQSRNVAVSALAAFPFQYIFHTSESSPGYFNNAEITVDKNNKLIGTTSKSANFTFQGIDNNPLNEQGSVVTYAFHTPETADKSFVELSPSNRLLNYRDRAGRMIDPNSNPVPDDGDGSVADALLPYIDTDNDRIRLVGAEDVPSALLRGVECLGVHLANDRHARAIVRIPYANNTPRAVSVLPNSDLIVPSAPRTLRVGINIGQSLTVGAQAGGSLVNTEAIYPEDVLMFDVGPNSDVRMGLATQGEQGEAPNVLDPNSIVGLKPLIAKTGQGSGNRGQTTMESMANTLVKLTKGAGIPFKMLCFVAGFGGTNYNGLKKGSQTYANMVAAVQRLVELAPSLGYDRVVIDFCCVKHGEADTNNAAYYEGLLEWQSDIQVDLSVLTGQVSQIHFIIAPPSSFYGEPTGAVPAMMRAHIESLYHHLSGPDYPYMAHYYTDLLHMFGPGYFKIGEKMAHAIFDALYSTRFKSNVLYMTGASRVGNTLTATFNVPYGPIVMDGSAPWTDYGDYYGFRSRTDSGILVPSSHTIIDAGNDGVGRINFTLPAIPIGENEVFEYAMHGHSGTRSAETIARGRCRDSDPRTSAYDGSRLYNWGNHQRIAVAVA